jgi:response regulator RpfG family c-di-GMP phosphodiesterase
MITSVNDSTPFRLEPDRTWLPVDALLEKPVEPQLLLSVVDKALKPNDAQLRQERKAPRWNDAQARPR